MRSVLVVVMLVVVSGCPPRPLGVGETRCSTTFGVTSCRSGPVAIQGQPMYAAPAREGFWCSVRPSDGYGFCSRGPGECEATRSSEIDRTFAVCARQPSAICGGGRCFATVASCIAFERAASRDGRLCFEER